MAADVARGGAGVFSAAEAAVPPEGWCGFADHWSSMPVDDYLPEGGTYRRRRYARVEATKTPDGWGLQVLPQEPFRQAADVVPLYGGRARTFPPVPPSMIASASLQCLLRLDLDLVSRIEGGPDIFVLGLHMVRVTAAAEQAVSPAPEGRHRDGHMFVVMHLIAREDCVGGASRVYGRSGMLFETTMTGFLDSVVVDDRRVQHEVEPITATGAVGWRDTLLVDFDRPEGR